MITLAYRVVRRIGEELSKFFDHICVRLQFRILGVKYQHFYTQGRPYVSIARGSTMRIGRQFTMINGVVGNPIGCSERCTFFVDRNAEIVIGDYVGISQAALIAMANIEIQDYVKIGGGTVIYTSDFHSLDPEVRSSSHDTAHRKDLPVLIKKNAFIGAKCIILKGVVIGENAVIGAGSVVTKDVPDNQIWGGNPARFIRNI